MLKRNLIYTAVTRSKDSLVLCGDEQAFNQAISRNDVDQRNSSLASKIRERLLLIPEPAEDSGTIKDEKVEK
jgi:exodeoxyribonuclease V alpha subunit